MSEKITKNIIPNPESLKRAIDQNEFVLHYQPKMSINVGTIIGLEALVRWQPPNQELIYPDEFIHIAEHTDLIQPLTKLIIEQAMKQFSSLSKRNNDLHLSINLSAENLKNPNLPDEINICAKKYGVNPANICFEITESAMVSEPKIALDILSRLRTQDYSISMDDFGTGYSSLIRLQHMPFNELKIDKSFIMNLERDTTAWTIVKSIIELGNNLGLKVVAEGVETQKVLEMLKDTNCHTAQGYLISKPIELSLLKLYEIYNPNEQ